MQEKHRRFAKQWSPERFSRWAETIGPATAALITEVLHARRHPEQIDALMALRPDLAVISEAAEPGRLLDRAPALAEASLVWVGRNPHKGLLLAGFGSTRLEFNRRRHDGRLHWMAPVAVSGLPGLDQPVHLLGVWAQNASEGNLQKNNPGFLQRALRRYRRFLRSAPAVVAGDFNNHVRWDRPGWRMNHANEIRALARLGLVSAYHVSRGVEAGNELEPTFYSGAAGPLTAITSTTCSCPRNGRRATST